MQKRKSGSLPIRCIETGQIFQSTKEAADSIGCTPPLISAHLKGKLRHARHLHFEYTEPDFMTLQKETSEVRDMIGYEGIYKVSKSGRIYSIQSGFEIMQNEQNNGYLMVNIRGKGKARLMTVHRIVAEAFIDNPDNLPFVNHKDENKHNNNADNLEWCTAKYNANYGTVKERHSATASFPVLCVETGIIYPSAVVAAKSLGMKRGTITHCLSGYAKTSGGYHWKYIKKEGE